MAKILENSNGRRTVVLNEEDIISVVREYQNLTCYSTNIEEIRKKLKKTNFYIPEDI